MNMKVFLTGATGSIGGSILESLISHGHTVMCVVRSEAKGETLVSKYGFRCSYLVRELSTISAPQFIDLAAGFDAIIHTAIAYTEEGMATEIQVVNALIVAAQKTAKLKPVSLIVTSGCLVVGDTNGIVNEDTASTQNPFPLASWRVKIEKKVMDSCDFNLLPAIIRPSWVYGNSFVDLWIRKCKENNKIAATRRNSNISLVHFEDIANIYRLVMERRGTGVFFASENEHITVNELIDRVSSLIKVNNIERFDDFKPFYEAYGNFILAPLVDQQIISKRINDLCGYVPKHHFREWLSNYHF